MTTLPFDNTSGVSNSGNHLLNSRPSSPQTMIDWHCHILPGIDDGPKEIEQSLAMAGILASHGFAQVYCTPHLIRGCYEASNDEVLQGIVELQQRIDASNIPLTLLSGREYHLDEYLVTFLKNPLPLGDSRLILVEIPPHITDDMVRNLVHEVVQAGFTPVIAHPERCHLLDLSARRPVRSGLLGALKNLISGGSPVDEHFDTTGNSLLDYLYDLGCSFQGNLGSFTGYYGRQAKAAAESLAIRGIYDRYGSDLHAPEQARHVFQTPTPC